uniref:WD repeat-containing protein 59-like n=1 Tax=Saccoglossus kowalevskii TaxID=10224 RepID=A0ABM0MYJ5_SACKO|nr:PREDICTED: WD repeat-containing protein 59-like [Saccoglossus kowalevskii]
MAARWNENIVAEHRDLQANAMSVDCTGQFAILAGKRVWAVINLDTPQDVVKKLSRQSRWEVSVVEWNPHVLQKNLFAATSNQSADIWSWADGCGRQIASLKAHTRVISDVNWSCFDSNMLATCSVDTYIYLWDIRDSRKPASALSAVAGAAQVKWNKIDSNYIATAHDGDIRIWDHRKNSTPVQYIAAHLSKIHGLDWEPKQELCLATSSQDGTVKFWDVTSPRQPQSTLNSTAPVWRARYTPFGNGLVTIVVPQLRRGENSLLLWNTDNLSVPMHTFIGHSDVVLEFQWRKFNEDSTDYQLVTWSRDHTLRLWKIDPHLQKLCGAEEFIDDVHRDMVSISPGSRHSSISGVAIEKTSLGSDKEQTGSAVEEINEKVKNVSSSATTVTAGQPQTLQQEFSLVNVSDITNVKLDLDAMHRSCKVTSVHVNNMVTLNVSFPANYPNNAAPDFTFTKPTNIDTKTKSKLLKILQETSHQHVKRNRTCLEPCIRKLVTGLETLTVDDKVQDSSQTPYNLQNVSVVKQPVMPIISYGSYRDHNIPFPRTSGARFCSVGKLVVFMRPVVKKSSNPENTPRSLSVLGTFRTLPIKGMASQTSQYNIYNTNLGSPTRDVEVSISNYYKDRDRERKIRGRGSSKHKRGWEVDYVKPTSSGLVTVYDIEIVLPIHKTLAQNYVLDHNDIPGMCKFGTLCQHCHREVKGAHCVECKRYSFQCAICHVAVKGSSNFCLSCRHGGHSHHMLEWFQTQDVCPTGCGCYCMQEDFQLYGRERTDSFSRSGHTGRERTDSFGRSGITSRERADSYGKSGFSNFL